MTRHADDLALAHVLADSADSISMARFRALDLHVAAKPDLSPVSDADTAVEQALRAILGRSRPRDAVLGEEYGGGGTAGGTRRWVIDPIDGTKNFIRGVPIWATLIALMEGDLPVVGLVSAPALARRWWAGAKLGAFAGRHPTAAQPIRVSGVDRLADASFCYSSLTGWESGGRLEPMLDVLRTCWRSRAYGDFYGYMLLAEGAVDVMAEPELSLWDLAALVPIVTEAGGTFTDLAGRPGVADLAGTAGAADLAGTAGVAGGGGGGSAVATNGRLHDEVLRRLAPAAPPAGPTT